MESRIYNSQYRSGWIGLLSGESLAKSLARVIENINADNQRVVFMVRDRWSIWRWIGAILIFILTIGFVGRSPAYLILTESASAHRERDQPRSSDTTKDEARAATALNEAGGAPQVPDFGAALDEAGAKALANSTEAGESEHGVFTPNPFLLGSDETVSPDPLAPGQVWSISHGETKAGPSLYRIEARVEPGSGVKILNGVEPAGGAPAPQEFRESTKLAEQHLYAQADELVVGRDPRANQFLVSLRATDYNLSEASLDLPTLLAFCSALLEKSIKGGLIVAGGLEPDQLHQPAKSLTNAAQLVIAAVQKGASTVLVPVSTRRQMLDLSDDIAARINVQFYSDTADALRKALLE